MLSTCALMYMYMLKNTGAMHVIWYLACNPAQEKGTYTQNNFDKTVLLKLIL